MKRTPLRSDLEKVRAFQQRGRGKLKRHSPMKRCNPKRKHRRFTEAFHSKAFVLWIKTANGCAVPGCERTDIECAHVGRPRSRGGRWWEVAPLCHPHHKRQEKRTRAFNAEFGIDLENIAHATALRWKAATYTSEE